MANGLWNIPGNTYPGGGYSEEDWNNLTWYGMAQKKAEDDAAKQAQISAMRPFLSTIPQGVYTSWLQGQELPFQNYYKDLYGDFYQEYQAALASQAQQGIEPGSTKNTLDFGAFLNSLDLNKRYSNLTQRQKGFYQPGSAPRTRFLNY